MSESREHADLVRCIYSYVKSIVPESLHCLIELDTIDTKKPPCVGGYIPDVYYHWMGHLIIGEAKTINDFSRTHSYQQFAAYITECRPYEENAALIIGVPWELLYTAKNYFHTIREKLEFNGKITIVVHQGASYRKWDV